MTSNFNWRNNKLLRKQTHYVNLPEFGMNASESVLININGSELEINDSEFELNVSEVLLINLNESKFLLME